MGRNYTSCFRACFRCSGVRKFNAERQVSSVGKAACELEVVGSNPGWTINQALKIIGEFLLAVFEVG